MAAYIFWGRHYGRRPDTMEHAKVEDIEITQDLENKTKSTPLWNIRKDKTLQRQNRKASCKGMGNFENCANLRMVAYLGDVR